ncbi:MAG: pitrilysin family protein [Cyanobacteria bacterium P01_F01_bin.42]
MQSTSGPVQHTLDNGLTIIAEQMPVDAVNFSLWIRAGSASERDEHNGIAHFLEHMVFKGSERLRPGDFERLVEQRGGTMNAVTSQDYTCFYHTVAPQDFAETVPAQIDLVLNAQIPKDEYERERQVVLEEIRRAEDNPRHRIFSQTMETAFTTLPYRRPILGPSSIIERLPNHAMVEHHRTYYQPRNMTAVVVGNRPVDQIIETVEAGFAAFLAVDFNQNGRDGLPELETNSTRQEPRFTSASDITVEDARLTQARLVLLWHVPGVNQVTQTYPFDLIAKVLSHGRNSKLVRELREQKGLVSSVSASNFTLAQHGLFWIAAQLPPDNIDQVKDIILQHVHDLHTTLVDGDRLAQLQRQMANQFIFENEAPSSRAGLYGYHDAIAHNLTAGLEYPQRIRQITLLDLQNAAQQYLRLDNYRCLRFTPA